MRTWPGLAAIGAGLIHLGIAAGAPVLQLTAFAAAGALEAGWGVAALARDVPPRPRTAVAVAAALIAGQLAVLLAGGHGGGAMHAGMAMSAEPAGIPVGAMLGAVALDLAVTALLGLRLRRGSGPGAQASAVRFLLGAAAGAAVVALVTASSLAGTAIGGHMH